MYTKCLKCNGRILSHNCFLKCDYCHGVIHINCLPNVTRNDSLYANRCTNVWYCMTCVQTQFPFNHFDDDDDFNAAIRSFQNDLFSNVNQDLSKVMFNPLDVNDDIMCPLINVDPDIQYFNDARAVSNISSCNYFLEDTFNNKFASIQASTCFSVLHHNIRSVQKNSNELSKYLMNLSVKFDIIGLTETWLNDANVDICGFPGYQSEHRYRSNRRGGGVSLFIKENIEYSICDDLCVFNDFMESMFIQIHNGSCNGQ